MKRKITAMIMAVLMVFTVCMIPTDTANAYSSTDTKWTDGVEGGAIYFDEATGTITDCDESVTSVVIPNKINGVSVKSIGNCAFEWCEKLTSITIPGSVTSIGDNAFSCCIYLKSITIPNSVTSIGDDAFNGCLSLPSITIPDSVTSIGDNAFAACEFLKSITIPDSVMSIGYNAFRGCGSLESITVDGRNINYSSKDGVLYNKSQTALIKYPTYNARKSFTIPNSVTSIGDCAFERCDPLTSITIPNSVTSIGDYAFSQCHLTSITIPDSVTSIDDWVFSWCGSLTSITIPNSVTSIGYSAFLSCRSLTSITIPDSVTDIGDDAFLNCYKLTIYGYAGSYAETYANDNDIPFVVLKERIKESQLYGEYCRYLSDNPAYKQMLGEVYADLDDIIYVSDDKATIAARSTALKNGVFANLKAIVGALTGKSYTEREYEEAVASDLLAAIAEDEYLLSEITKKVKKQYKATSDTYKLISNGYKTAAAYNAYAVGFANNYSQDEVLQVIESVNKNWKSISKVFEAAGVAVNAFETAVTVIIARDTDIYTMDKISGAIDKDSALHNGLKRISNKKKGTTGDALVTEWIKNDAFEFVADKIIKLGSGAVSIAEFGFKVLGYFEGLNSDGADMEDIDKGFIALSNDAQIRLAVNDIIYNMALQNQNGGNKDYSEDFKFFKQAQFTAIDECVKYANKIGTAKQKKKLNADYNKYKSLFNIDSYIKSCLANANADWKYKVVDGKAVITGIQKDSTASASTFASIADRLGLVAYADDENDVMNVLVIPDKIDDYEVTGIDSSAFANDTDIEFAYIPGSVNAIGESAFEGCSSLKAVFFDRGIETIDANAFADCNGLDSVSIPASVTTIDNNAFSGNEELTVYAAKGTEGEAYAESGSATYEAVEPEVTELKVESLPSKTTYKMSEEDVDTTGLKVTATFETGDTKDVTGEVYCCFDDKQLGTSKVIVAYGTDETTFDVTIEADECTYTVSYEDELGNELAEKVSGKAMAGTEVALDVKDINGYVPIEDEQTVTIGQYNDFVVLYSAEPPKDITNAEVEEIGDAFYTGSSQTPKLTVSFNGKQLTEGEDYSVVYDENIAIGEGKAMIIGSGDYCGTKEVSFNIVSQPLKADKVSLSSSSYTYSGGVKTPSVKVTDISGNTLSKDKDYTVSYQSGRKYVSTYKVVVKGIGNYSGSVTKTFNINPQGTYITKLSKGSKRFTVKWKKRTTQVTGYQVRYSTSSSMAGAKTTTITKYKTTSKTIKKLKAKKKYYVQVRTYKTVSGKKYYSGWSSRKYVKTR